MSDLHKIKRRGVVTKVIKSVLPGGEETVEIQVEGTDPLYGEIRIANSFEDGDGNKISLTQGARVSITFESEAAQVSAFSDDKTNAAAS